MKRRSRGRAGIRCARGDRVSPVRIEELEGGYRPGAENQLTIVIPPDIPRRTTARSRTGVAWIDDPNGDGIICAPVAPGGPGCAGPEEVAEYLAGLANAERAIAAMCEVETGKSTGRDDIAHLGRLSMTRVSFRRTQRTHARARCAKTKHRPSKGVWWPWTGADPPTLFVGRGLADRAASVGASFA